MQRFEGDQDLSLPPAELWVKLTNPRFLVHCVPGIESIREQDEKRASFALRPGLAFMRGTLEVTLEVAEAANPSARFLLHSKGIGSTSDVEATLAIAPREAGSRVHWTAEVKQLGGLLKAVPRGLIEAAAKKVINDAWAAVGERLRQDAIPPPAT
jgi:carbon monoxide dehydrogenase subunit G